MTRERTLPFNPGEGMNLRTRIGKLHATAAEQLLLGVVQILSSKSSVSRKVFEEILDDAEKYSDIKKQH